MKIGILTAMESEYKQFVSLQEDNKADINTIVVRQCGIGKVNAAMRTYDLIVNERPDMIVSTGVAGGCGDYLNIMDIVCADTLCYHDVWCGNPNVLGQIQGLPDSFTADHRTLGKINALHFTNLKVGKIISGDWFVDSIDKMQEIKNNFPDAVAVDMESAAIAHICYLMNTPFIALRVISDLPLQGKNHEQYKDFWKNVSDNSFRTAKQIIMSL